MAQSSEKVQLEFEVDETKYDESNPLIVSSDRLKASKNVVSKFKKKEQIKTQLLSKKKKKKLEKILEKKNRKLNRAELINDLQKYQVKAKESYSAPPISVIQTTGKRRLNELLDLYKSVNAKNEENEKIQEPIHKKLKFGKKLKLMNEANNGNHNDPNVIGFELEDSSESSEEESENEPLKSDAREKINENIKSSETSQEEFKHLSEKTEENVSENISDSNKKTEKPIRKSIYVPVDRPEEIQKARSRLPILAEEHNIMEAIMENPVIIICGETGSGKTTQVPQFLYEAGYATNGKMIGITEPRRVAAISMSKRVAYELNLSNKEVSYQIRFEGNATETTQIKFMTDGILMKEIEKDFLLRKYSALIIDEAHERSLYSDILIGFLSRIIQVRHKKCDPLKLIIMSATLRIEDFTQNSRLFKVPPPVIKIDSRQYPVSIHFSKFTNSNYIQEAFKKVCKIHTVSPAGGILVFVTGRKEVQSLCKMFRDKFPYKKSISHEDQREKKKSEEETSNTNENEESKNQDNLKSKPKVNLDIYSINPIENTERIDDEFDCSDDGKSDASDNEYDDDLDLGFLPTQEPLYCLPLYSMMPSDKQSMVFKGPPPGCRLCVIATNVAETSLTIPNIKYVIDSGKIKNKVYDNVTGISTFVINWTSKASADQRAGRAGRTSAGHCYRLYSSAVFNDQFKQYSDPEIIIKPVDDLLLQMKSIGIENVINFPFPTLPNVESLIAAEKRLIFLDALEEKTFIGKKNKELVLSRITPIGKLMSCFPVNPRYSKMLCLSNQCDLMPYTLTIISALTVQELFNNDGISEAVQKRRKNAFFTSPFCQILGDLMSLLTAFGAASFEGLSQKFCELHGLRHNAIVEISKLRQQLFNQIKLITKNPGLSLEMPIPNENQVRMLSQMFLCGFGDHIAKRVPFILITEKDDDGQIKKVRKSIRNCYQCNEVEDYVFISPHSILFNQTPEYVVYHEIFESSKMYMRNIVPIQAEWLPIYASKHCTFSNPLEQPPPRYDFKQDRVKCFRTSTYGRYNWDIPAVEVDYPETPQKYCYFAYFLFEGQVLKWFAKNVKFMSSPSIIFIKSWAMIQPKAENVIKRLTSDKISTRQAILDKWKIDPKYLLKEYLQWIHEAQHDNIRKNWPPKS